MIFIYNFVFISILIVTVQIADSYLRYLAFSKKISKEENKKLWIKIFGWACFAVIFYSAIFFIFGAAPLVYKLFLIFGWIPFFVIAVKSVKISLLQHFFIFNMAAVWSLILHSLTAMIDITFFKLEPQIIFTCHALIYVSIFLILLPIERKCFFYLLPSVNFFDNQPYGKYIVLMPLVIVSSVLILWADNELIHSWQERLSRMYLPFTFFLFYRYVLTANKQIFENKKISRYNQHLKKQLATLEEYNLLMQENQQQMKILRHDMRHKYNLIYSMLQDGKIKEVQEYIKIQENILDLTTVKFFCYAPLVNAALSIYLQKAENLGIKIKHKINLPENFNTDENDFAILISNLLENAINAEKIQPPGKREISITIEHIENQCILEIINFFDGEIIFENGLPKTFAEGHGIGMQSLKNFSEKYDAQIDFSQEFGKVKVIVYWEDVKAF